MKSFNVCHVLLVAVLIGFSMHGPLASAQVTPPKTMKVKIGIGLGYQLCPHRSSLPDLGDAFSCSGMNALPQPIELELVNKPAAKPTWLYYEAPYSESVIFQKLKARVEMLVMYGKMDGKAYGFVDGRIITEKNGKFSAPVYFRASAEGGLENLTYTSAYGPSAAINISGGKAPSEWSPYVAFTAVP